MIRYLTIILFIIEVWLSHTPGRTSGNQSKWLSSMTGIKESLLRRAAHVVLFILLAWSAAAGFSWPGVIGTMIWGVLDEVSKIPIPGRHFCLWPDVVLNLVGGVVGTGLWLLIW